MSGTVSSCSFNFGFGGFSIITRSTIAEEQDTGSELSWIGVSPSGSMSKADYPTLLFELLKRSERLITADADPFEKADLLGGKIGARMLNAAVVPDQ